MNLRKSDMFLLDLDDTLWRVTKLLPGAEEFMDRLRTLDKKVYFVTNNNIMTRQDTAWQLMKLGIAARKEEVINTGYVASVYLKKRDARVMAFGKGLVKELKENHIKVSNKPPVDYVVIGDDLEFNFDKIALAMEAIEKGAKFISCNLGKRWHIGNKLLPGVGSLAASIAYATDVEPIILGKPHPPMVQVTKKFVKNPSRAVMIGNDVLDVIFAKKLKCKSVLLSSKQPKGIKSNLRVRSIKDLLKFV